MGKYVPDLNLSGIVIAKRKKPKKQLFSEGWARDVLTYAKEHWETDFYLYCCFIVSAGLRPSEAYALTWGDLSAEPVSALSRDEKVYKMGLLSIDKATVRNESRSYVRKNVTKTDAGERALRLDWSFFQNLYDCKTRGADHAQILTLKPNLVDYRWKKCRAELAAGTAALYESIKKPV